MNRYINEDVCVYIYICIHGYRVSRVVLRLSAILATQSPKPQVSPRVQESGFRL